MIVIEGKHLKWLMKHPIPKTLMICCAMTLLLSCRSCPLGFDDYFKGKDDEMVWNCVYFEISDILSRHLGPDTY